MLVKIIGKMKISSRIFVIYIINIAIITINTIKTITMPIFCQDFFPMLHHEESPEKPQYIIWQPPPRFVLAPPFLAKIFSPLPHLYQF